MKKTWSWKSRGTVPLNFLLHVQNCTKWKPQIHGVIPCQVRRWDMNGWLDFKCREVKTGFCRKRSMQTSSSGTLIRLEIWSKPLMSLYGTEWRQRGYGPARQLTPFRGGPYAERSPLLSTGHLADIPGNTVSTLWFSADQLIGGKATKQQQSDNPTVYWYRIIS